MFKPYNPVDHYWIVGEDTARLWSSAVAAYVPIDAAASWCAAGGTPTRIASEAELREVLLVQYPAGWPGGALAERRWRAETGGTVWNGWPVPTDRESQAKTSAAYVMAKDGHWPVGGGWKFADGTWRALTAEQVQEMALAVAAHVQACFAIEAAKQADPAADINTGWPVAP